ncbi:MAG: hypothetical protein ACRDUY_11530 [Nitriliruptorales bacterium]
MAVVPAAPLLLPEVSPDQPPGVREGVEELRGVTRRCLERLPPADAYVLVAAGPRGIYDRAEASLAPVGVPDVAAELPTSDELLEHLPRLTQYPVLRGVPLDVSHAVLAMLLHEVRGSVTTLPVSAPPGADFDVLVSVGAAIAEAGRDADLTVAVVCAGDLSAALHEHSPAGFVDGAPRWDEAVLGLFRDGDLAGLRDLGPEESTRVHALGWAPLTIAHGACAAGRLKPGAPTYLAPRGVGELVAACLPRGDGESGRPTTDADADTGRFTRERTGREGVVPRTGDPRG